MEWKGEGFIRDVGMRGFWVAMEHAVVGRGVGYRMGLRSGAWPGGRDGKVGGGRERCGGVLRGVGKEGYPAGVCDRDWARFQGEMGWASHYYDEVPRPATAVRSYHHSSPRRARGQVGRACIGGGLL